MDRRTLQFTNLHNLLSIFFCIISKRIILSLKFAIHIGKVTVLCVRGTVLLEALFCTKTTTTTKRRDYNMSRDENMAQKTPTLYQCLSIFLCKTHLDSLKILLAIKKLFQYFTSITVYYYIVIFEEPLW